MASHFVSLSELATLGIDFSVFSFCYGTRNQRSVVGVCVGSVGVWARDVKSETCE
jgi:hypothetical protein